MRDDAGHCCAHETKKSAANDESTFTETYGQSHQKSETVLEVPEKGPWSKKSFWCDHITIDPQC